MCCYCSWCVIGFMCVIRTRLVEVKLWNCLTVSVSESCKLVGYITSQNGGVMTWDAMLVDNWPVSEPWELYNRPNLFPGPHGRKVPKPLFSFVRFSFLCICLVSLYWFLCCNFVAAVWFGLNPIFAPVKLGGCPQNDLQCVEWNVKPCHAIPVNGYVQTVERNAPDCSC